MRKLCSFILAVCMLCSLSVAYAESWACRSCGSTASGSSCSRCGSMEHPKVSFTVPADVFGVPLLETEEHEELTFYFYGLPESCENDDEIYIAYMKYLLGKQIDYEWSDEDEILFIDLYGTGEASALLTVADGCLIFAVLPEAANDPAPTSPSSGSSSSGSSSSGSSSSRSSSSGSSGSRGSSNAVKTRCVKCHGDGKITCSNCSGKGYKTKTSYSTPNYSGKKGGSKRVETKETCYKCHGSGTITCTRCGGSGTN